MAASDPAPDPPALALVIAARVEAMERPISLGSSLGEPLMRRSAPSLALLLLAAPALAQQPLEVKTEKANLVVETVARGLDHPWGLAFLPDGRMLVTERPGRLRLVSAKGELSQPLAG